MATLSSSILLTFLPLFSIPCSVRTKIHWFHRYLIPTTTAYQSHYQSSRSFRSGAWLHQRCLFFIYCIPRWHTRIIFVFTLVLGFWIAFAYPKNSKSFISPFTHSFTTTEKNARPEKCYNQCAETLRLTRISSPTQSYRLQTLPHAPALDVYYTTLHLFLSSDR